MKEYIKPIDFVRWALTVLLIVGVHSETGTWTTVFAFLVALTMEAQQFLNKVQLDANKHVISIIQKIT